MTDARPNPLTQQGLEAFLREPNNWAPEPQPSEAYVAGWAGAIAQVKEWAASLGQNLPAHLEAEAPVIAARKLSWD